MPLFGQQQNRSWNPEGCNEKHLSVEFSYLSFAKPWLVILLSFYCIYKEQFIWFIMQSYCFLCKLLIMSNIYPQELVLYEKWNILWFYIAQWNIKLLWRTLVKRFVAYIIWHQRSAHIGGFSNYYYDWGLKRDIFSVQQLLSDK